MDEPLRVAPGLVIPAEELRWRFDTSGGPGGQHANKSSTRVELAFDVAASPAVPEPLRAVLLERLGGRLAAGVLHLVVSESRSQWRNRQIARRRLVAVLEEALRPRRSRRPTRPTGAARLRRLAEKRRRGESKRNRRPPDHGDD
jgi:ribosome-associated protein